MKKIISAVAIVLCLFATGCNNNNASVLESENATLKSQISLKDAEITTLKKQNEDLEKKLKDMTEEKSRLARMLTDAGLSTNPEEISFNECRENLKKISVGLKLYSADHKGTYPKKLSEISPDPRYLDFVPTCPSASKDTYTSGYQPSRDLKSYKVCCLGHNHKSLMIKENNPSFDSVTGLQVERDTEIQQDDETNYKEEPTKEETKDTKTESSKKENKK